MDPATPFAWEAAPFFLRCTAPMQCCLQRMHSQRPIVRSAIQDRQLTRIGNQLRDSTGFRTGTMTITVKPVSTSLR
jgi:hypothetical protein